MEEIFDDFRSVIIRTPLYSYVELYNQKNDTRDLEDLVHIKLQDPVFLEALYWSSPQLFSAALKFKEGNLKGSKEIKLMQTLKKYLIRACTRCTPYGIFASTGIATPGLQQANQERNIERKVRLDMGLLQNIKSQIESDPLIYPHLYYSINNSLYTIPGQYRYTEKVFENGKCTYQLSALEHILILLQITELGRDKMITLNDIFDLTDQEISYDECSEFINELIRSQYLVSELQLSLTITDEIERFVTILNRLKKSGVEAAQKYLDLFLFIENILIQFKKLPIGVLPFKEINDLIYLLTNCGIEGFQEHLFQADLKESFKEYIIFPGKCLKDIKKGILILGKLTNNYSSQKELQRQFIKLFREKYETREISLSEVLDPEFGIGFPPQEKFGHILFNSLIEKVDLTTKDKIEHGIGNFQTKLQDKIEALNIQFVKEDIELRDEELKSLDDKSSTLPNTFSVMGRLLPSGKILLESIGGAHSNALLGRFAYLDNKIQELCNEVADVDHQNKNEIIFAEIIFIPEGRVGNIARRPVFTGYEIPILACSGVNDERQISISDIFVSIHDDEIILRSEKLNKRIIPRLSNAHNYFSSTVPVYKFLASIQNQGTLGLEINWGDFAANKRFLPRIIYKNIILHRASWFLYKNDIKTIVDSPNSMDQLRMYFQKWNVPQFICFAEGDNELFIDTSNSSYLEILLEEIKSRNSVKFIEWLYEKPSVNRVGDTAPIQQFILPIAKKKIVIIKPIRKLSTLNEVQRTFEPGTEWIYFKIYCGATFSDRILLNVVKPAINYFLEENIITGAFFVRYTDPHYHIRFRLHLVQDTNRKHLARAMKLVYELLHPLCASHLVWKVQLDTYQREIERYGAAMEASEIVFFHDSLLILNCLLYPEFVEDEQIRFFSAIQNIDKWLNLFKMGVEEKAGYCNKICNRFLHEYKPEIKIEIDVKYREFKNLLPVFFSSENFNKEFRLRDAQLWDILWKEHLADYIHMSMNRWFVNQQRLMEYMCYSFCNKYYHQLLYSHQKVAKISLDHGQK